MPIIKSAKKRVRVATKAAARNNRTKRNLKEAFKALHRAVTGGKAGTQELHGKTQSAIDKAVKKGVLSKHKAARKASQAAKVAKAAAKTTTPVVAKAKKTTAKVVAKKPAAKKVATKAKAPTKKPVAKKTVTKK